MRRLLALFVFLPIASASIFAQPPQASWKFDKAADFHGHPVAAPNVNMIETVGDSVKFGLSCWMHVSRQPYRYDLPFQMLLKGKVSEQAMSKFLQENFGLDPLQTKYYYPSEESPRCSDLSNFLFITNDGIILSNGDSTFFKYKKQSEPVSLDDVKTADYIAGVKLSTLPFKLDDVGRCFVFSQKPMRAIPKCAPYLFMNIALKGNKDKLSRIVGEYNFDKNGSAQLNFSSGWAQGIHPMFIVFPPLGQVILAHVFNMEDRVNEDVPYNSAYVAIRNGKIVDTLGVNCNFDMDYVCSSPEIKEKYTVTADGKFVTKKN